MDRANILIVGGGIVGCAIACAAARRWEDVFVVEQLPKVGMATSTRNSGVIHSGLYYPRDSLKARHCVEGNRLTYEFCEKHNVPHRRTGKLIVATSQEEAQGLEELAVHGRGNGVGGIRPLDAAGIRAREPHVRGVAALEVPSTGIVSSEELVKAYARTAVGEGAHIVTHAKVEALEPHADFIHAMLRVGDVSGSSQERIEARCVINAAGLFSDEVAALLGNTRYRIYPVRGEYCEIRGPRASLINNLVYPLPHAEGLSLGVHFTKTLWGTVLVGPTARYVQDKNDYEHERLSVADFARRAQEMLPEVTEDDLQLAYSGLRPKLIPPGEKGYGDFIITRDPAVPRAIHLIGIESPGLTAAPSIAEHVFQLSTEILR